MEDKRRLSRVDFYTSGNLMWSGRSIPFELVNISLKGVLLSIPSNENLDMGETGKIDILLPNSSLKISVDATLVHREKSNFGFKFLEIDLDSMIHLRKLMEYNTADPKKIGEELAFLDDM